MNYGKMPLHTFWSTFASTMLLHRKINDSCYLGKKINQCLSKDLRDIFQPIEPDIIKRQVLFKLTNQVPHISGVVKETCDHLMEEDVGEDVSMVGGLVSRAFRLNHLHQGTQSKLLGRKERTKGSFDCMEFCQLNHQAMY